MLGAVDREHVYRIVDALAGGDGTKLLAEGDALAARGLSATSALDELASLFHRIAVAQAVPAAASNFDDASRVSAYAQRFTPEAVQLCYQICVQGRADLAIAPDEATGFGMTLLRLLAFEPGTTQAGLEAQASAPARDASAATSAANLGTMRAARPAPVESAPAEPASRPPAELRSLPDDAAGWPRFVAGLKLTGLAAQLAAQSELRSVDGHVVNLGLPASHKHLADRAYSDKLKVALEQATGRKLMLAFEVGEATPASLASQERREREEARERTEAAFRDEPFVRELVERFDGTVRSESIKPAG
jgi:DNA polymerase-3 subunit gamma/tau